MAEKIPGVGDIALDFNAPVSPRERVTLSQYKGKKVVLAFYVADFTGG